MRIKYAEGQTLLTLTRVAIAVVACLCVAGVYSLISGIFSTADTARDSMQDIIGRPSAENTQGEPTVLYYKEVGPGGSQVNTYQMFYITGSEGAYGLTDAGGNRLLPDMYQGIILLPHTYLLKQGGYWRFYDKETLVAKDYNFWEEAEVLRTENGAFASYLVCVRRDGLYGATNMLGQVAIQPIYESFQMSSLTAKWPLIKVKQYGKYGFINSSGQVIVTLSYDFARVDSIMLYKDENDAEGVEIPIIYVLRDGDWGAMYRNSDGSSSDVDWSVEPTSEVLAAYEQEI